ncbi:MAG: PQQ-binding-like beta-propeller repeat protein [Gemmatimonadaceae bacterium]
MIGRAGVASIALSVAGLACGELAPAAPRDGVPRLEMDRVLHVPTDRPFSSLQTPVADADRLYADFSAGPVVAFDRRTGSQVWTYARPFGAPSSLVLHNGRLLFVGSLAIALDAATGTELWHHDPGANGGLGVSAAADGHFYFGTDSSIHALSVETGSPAWRVDFGADWEFRSVVRGVAVDGDELFASIERFHSETGHLGAAIVLALDRRTGLELWRHTEGDGSDRHLFIFEPRVAGDLILVSDFIANVTIALDRATGAVRWRRQGDATGYAGAFEPPLVRHDTVFVVSGDQRITALHRATGEPIWGQKVGGSLSSAAFCGRYLLVQDLYLHVLDRATGAFIARYAHTKPGESGLLVSRFTSDGDVAFVLGNNAAYGFRCR